MFYLILQQNYFTSTRNNFYQSYPKIEEFFLYRYYKLLSNSIYNITFQDINSQKSGMIVVNFKKAYYNK